MGIRTDMAAEAFSQAGGAGQLEGVNIFAYTDEKTSFEITDITIENDEAAQKLGKPVGRYVTVRASDQPFDMYSDCFEDRAELLADIIKKLCGGADKALVAGLGNKSITPDAVGPLAAEEIFATRHIKRLSAELDCGDLAEITAVSTGVLGQTGLEAAEQVSALTKLVKPQVVVVIDALACSEMDNLGRSVQLCDTGISPGSGVENARKELSENTLGVKCIAIGVPTVVDLTTAAEHIFGSQAPDTADNMIVTPKSVDRLVQNCAKLIAMAVNRAFHTSLTQEDIQSLVF